jgi:integrase
MFTKEMMIEMIKTALSELNPENTITFHEYVKEQYLPYFLSKKRTKDAIRIEKLRISVLLELIPSGTQLSKITENDVKIMLNTISKRQKGNATVSSATVNRYHSRLLAIFNHAIREGIMQKNPARNFKKAKEAPRNRVLSHAELTDLLKACKESKNEELHDIMAIACFAGMRLGEVRGLQLFNIDFEKNQIVLSEQQTKQERSNTIPIHTFIRPILQSRVSIATDEGRKKLFKSHSIRTAEEHAIKRAGLRGFICRDLRRTFATGLKNNNIHIHTISSLLGHSSVSMTEKYIGTDFGTLERAVLTLPVVTLVEEKNNLTVGCPKGHSMAVELVR